nr:urease accessory protein UreD [Streptacidiphilus neutrinimicus]
MGGVSRPADAGGTSRLSAVARIRAAADGRGDTALRELVGDGPLALRRSRHPDDGGAAHVVLVGAMAAPLGGDRLRVEAVVEPGARLLVTSAAATVSLPGRDPGPASYELELTVAADAELVWRPEPVIAAAGSALRLWTRVSLAPGARLHLREEQVLGRHGEPPGRLTSRLTVRQDGRLVLDQSTDVGAGAPPGWDGPAVLDGRRALGQLLTTRPCAQPPPAPDAASGTAVDTAAFPVGHGLTLLTALAPDVAALRAVLAQGKAPG